MLNNMKRLIASLTGWYPNVPIADYKAYSGAKYALSINTNSRYFMSAALRLWRTSGASYGVVFGTSNIPTNEEDYCLKGDLLTNLNISVLAPSNEVVPIATDDFVGFVVSYTITAKSDVQIGEMGVLVATATSTSENSVVMIDRVTFDEPIVLKTGESKTITYRMKIG